MEPSARVSIHLIVLAVAPLWAASASPGSAPIGVGSAFANAASPYAVSAYAAAIESLGPSARIVSDQPGRLEIEVRLTDVTLRSDVGAPGLRVQAAGFARARKGAPDLPVFAINAPSSAAQPRVSLRVLESETRVVPQGLAPVPTPTSPSARRFDSDAAAFVSAAQARVEMGPLQHARGASLRALQAPMALWSQASHTLTLLKRVRIAVEYSSDVFAGAGGSEAKLAAGLVGAEPVAAKAAAAQTGLTPTRRSTDGVSAPALGDTLIRIRIGDAVIDNFDEDKVYALAYRDAAAIAPGLAGTPIAHLRMYAGPNDTLTRAVAGQPSSGGLAEVPIDVVDGNNDGTFDEGDTLTFYAHGTSVWRRISGIPAPQAWRFSSDPYSFYNYYYLDFSGRGSGEPLRLRAAPGGPNAGAPQTSAYYYLHAEKDLGTAACDISQPPQKDEETGFDWFWFFSGDCNGTQEMILSGSQLADAETDSLKGLDTAGGDSLYVGLFTFPQTTPNDFGVRVAGMRDSAAYRGGDAAQGNWYAGAGFPSDGHFRFEALRWGGLDQRFEGYSVGYPRRFALAGNAAWIFPSAFARPISYRVQGGEGALCLRIESGVPTRAIRLDVNGIFTDTLADSADARYFVYRTAAPLPPAALSVEALPARMAIRDLATGDGKHPDYLIIAPRALADAATALRDFRNQSQRALPLHAEVAFIEDIYRQYSGGRMSPPALRDFIRWAYAEWNAPGSEPLRYVVLLGDGHYDYRGIATSAMAAPPPNLIPPYELFAGSAGSGEEIASDDFYALLDSGETVASADLLDVAVGRVPVRTSGEAMDYVAKLRDYEDPAKAGDWRGRTLFAADDDRQLDKYDGIFQGHTTSSDNLSRLIEADEPGVTTDKIYLLDYKANSAYHKPEATQDLLALINRGAALVNYVGHGAYFQWADEALMQTNDALARMHNEGKTPMINAFSCTVGRFESARYDGMSEQFVRERGKGAIAALSATRESYPDENVALADAFYRRAFPLSDSLSAGAVTFAGPAPAMPIGEALRLAKNSPQTLNGRPENDRKYALLGDPALLLRKPQLSVSITKAMDTIRALDCGEIAGRVEGGSGSGFVNLKILAGSTLKTWPEPADSPVSPQFALKRGNILFERTFAYSGHAFSSAYFIPRQISYGDTNARILVFAWDGSQEREGTAAKGSLRIQGTSTGPCANVTDTKGPNIRISGCEKRETGDVDFPARVKLPLPYCLQITVEDSVGGVLTADGPDEGTLVEIPGALDPFHPTPGLDSLTRKVYQVPLQKEALRPGPHLLEVSAQDGYGNLSTRTLQMELAEDSSLSALSAYNFPNPMKRNGTTFHFSALTASKDAAFGTSVSSDRLSFEVRVYNQAGALVRDFRDAQSGATAWDGRDSWGNLLANGVYFYTVTARQTFADPGEKPDYRTVSAKRNVLVISR